MRWRNDTQSATVHVIEDDKALRDSIQDVLMAAGFHVETYTSALDFSAAVHRDLNGCIVTDVRMPRMTGLDVLRKLSEVGLHLPVIVVTGYADVHLAVEAMKLGAVDFLEKPLHWQELIDAIRGALRARLPSSTEVQREEIGQGSRARRELSTSPEEGAALIRAFLRIESAEVREYIVKLIVSLSSHQGLGPEANVRIASLTKREREVLDLVVAGEANKVIAARLGISLRTVETHRGRVMKKLKAQSITDLVRLAIATGE
jgi:two-component system response regulator FixJ